jgi:IS5 family transposase
VDLGRAPAPDETTILNFRHLLEEQDLCGQMLDAVNLYLESRGIRITTGHDRRCDDHPRALAGQEREEGTRPRDASDQERQAVVFRHEGAHRSRFEGRHRALSLFDCASVSDVHMLPELLHGDEKKVQGDAGYHGQTEAIREAAPQAQDMTSRRVKTKAGVDEAEKRRNSTKARVRAKVEWPLRIVKRVFGFTKVRHRGLKKNHQWMCAGCALANLYKNRKRLAKINLRLSTEGV